MDNLTAAPLFVAAQEGHLTVVTKLIAAGALVNKARTGVGATPLWIAAQNGHTAYATPLWIAAQNGHTATVSKALQHGADKSIPGWHNETPLDAARRRNHAIVVALLV